MRLTGLPLPPNMQSISENTSPGSMASSAEPMSGSMVKMMKLVGLAKALMHSWYLTISVEANSTSIARCSSEESELFSRAANLS